MKKFIVIFFLLIGNDLYGEKNPGQYRYSFKPELNIFYFKDNNNDYISEKVFFYSINSFCGVLRTSRNIEFNHELDFYYFFNDNGNDIPASDLNSNNDSILNNFYIRQMGISIPFETEENKIILRFGLLKTPEEVTGNTGFLNLLYPPKTNGIDMFYYNNSTGLFHFIFLDLLNFYQVEEKKIFVLKDKGPDSNLSIGNGSDSWMSFRSGILYQSPNFLKEERKDFISLGFIFTRYGNIFNNDRPFQGDQIENDYIFHYNISNYFQYKSFKWIFEFSLANGIDRKLKDLTGYSRDREISGYLFRNGFSIDLKNSGQIRHRLGLDFFYSAKDKKNKMSYGYLGCFRPDLGGLIISSAWGLSPYALSQPKGIYLNQSEKYYHADSLGIASLAYHMELYNLKLDFINYLLSDTTNSFFKQIYGFETDLGIKIRIQNTDIRIRGGAFLDKFLLNNIGEVSRNYSIDIVYGLLINLEVYF